MGKIGLSDTHIYIPSNSEMVEYPSLADTDMKLNILICSRYPEYDELIKNGDLTETGLTIAFNHFLEEYTVTFSYEGSERVLSGYWYYWDIRWDKKQSGKIDNKPVDEKNSYYATLRKDGK